MSRITPTVGRVVWFTPGASDDIPRNGDRPLAAIVANVWSDSCVNLAVFDANGVSHSRTSVYLLQGGDDPPAGSPYCEWMPYQKGQAAKTEALEARIDASGPQVDARITQSAREAELEDLLISAHAIAERNGHDTAWERFANRLKAAGIGSITAKTFRVLPEGSPVSFVGTPVENARPPGRMEFRPVATPVQDSEIPNNGPRVTPTDIEAEVASEHYFTAKHGVLGEIASDGVPATAYERANAAPAALGLLTFCVLVLRNGFTVVGTSACASPKNFDADIGRRIARQDAVRQVWPLLGYALRNRLAGQ